LSQFTGDFAMQNATYRLPSYWMAAILDEIQYDESLWDSTQLGCSPAELVFNPEQDRERSWSDHDGCPELRLWEDGFSPL